jgi:Sec-independent protein translocase protein TatA
VFGVGPQELVIIVLLFVVVFGPGKAVSMARDLGRLANEARGHVEEFKGELLDGDEDRVKPASKPHSEDAGDEVREREEGGELSHKEQAPPSEVRARIE